MYFTISLRLFEIQQAIKIPSRTKDLTFHVTGLSILCILNFTAQPLRQSGNGIAPEVANVKWLNKFSAEFIVVGR